MTSINSDEEIARLVGEGGNATLPEIETPKCYVLLHNFDPSESIEAKVFLSIGSLNKCLLSMAVDLDRLSEMEELINRGNYQVMESVFDFVVSETILRP